MDLKRTSEGSSTDESPQKKIKSNASEIHEPKGISTLKRIRIGSRKSQLALFQTNYVVELLRKKHPDIKYEIITITTTGDRILNVPLSKIGAKSLFTKELEVALDNNEIDMIVHSLKDLPTTLPEGMVIGGVCRRDSPYDAVVMSSKYTKGSLESLPEGSVIGTSSLRRIAQLKRTYPQLRYTSIRGNLNTRLRKLDEESVYDALILAVAGLDRMDLSNRISTILPSDSCMYAVGQGAIAVECKSDNAAALDLMASITDRDTVLRCVAERAFMKTLEGGCSVPVAVCSTLENSELVLRGGVFSLDGSEALIETISKTLNGENKRVEKKEFCGIMTDCAPQYLLNEAEELGRDLAAMLQKQGANKILLEARVQNDNS